MGTCAAHVCINLIICLSIQNQIAYQHYKQLNLHFNYLSVIYRAYLGLSLESLKEINWLMSN